MGLAMHRKDGGRRRGFDKAEPRPPLLVEPVGEHPAGIVRLNFEIFLVEGGNRFSGYAVNVMAVHENRHDYLRRVIVCLRRAVHRAVGHRSLTIIRSRARPVFVALLNLRGLAA